MSDLLSTLPSLREWRDVDRGVFEVEIVPLAEPAILRGVVGALARGGAGRALGPLAIARTWPASTTARRSTR